MVDFTKKERYTFEDLVKLVAFLRSENGCEWDRAQTHLSIRRNFLEEAYEVADAIDDDDPSQLCEELGDVLLQVVFHSGIEKDRGRFDESDVCTAVCRKMIRRHPHLFGGEAKDWETIKSEEKGARTPTERMLGVAKSLPALVRAEKVLEKAGQDLPVSESLPAFGTEDALGDLLLSAVSAALRLGLDAETALTRATDRYVRRCAGQK